MSETNPARSSSPQGRRRDYCFGMGNNRDYSLDSRYWGFIPVDDITGKPWLIYWSQAPESEEEVRWNRIFKSVE